MTATATNHIAILEQADACARDRQTGPMLAALRALSLEQIGKIFLKPPPEYPHLASVLPPMASDEVQKSWTGACGEGLLQQSVEFVQMLESGFREFTGRELAGSAILDFGCGWGRLIRLMYRYSDPVSIFGVDAWEDSLAQCRAAGLYGNFGLIGNLPRDLPFDHRRFDLIYAYSVFTHLSPKTANIARATLRKRIARNGLLVITIRPPEYWHAHHNWPDGYTVASMLERHQQDGIAYIPHFRPPTEGELTFGDTSIAEDYIRRNWQDWELVGARPLQQDPLQLVAFLKPRRRLFGLFG